MAKYRNISKETLIAFTPAGAVEVPHGGLIDGDDSVYWQTGVQGETALWEAVDAAAKSASKSHAQSESVRSGAPAEPVEPKRSPSQNTTSEGDQ